jgi:N-acetylglucosamine kinase-like BadF-type ATPase
MDLEADILEFYRQYGVTEEDVVAWLKKHTPAVLEFNLFAEIVGNSVNGGDDWQQALFDSAVDWDCI